MSSGAERWINPKEMLSETLSNASLELASEMAKDSASCTRALTRWKLELLPAISTDDLQLFSCSQSKDSSLSTLLAIINDEMDFTTTEGHRESSLEIVRGILQRAFGQQQGNIENATLQSLSLFHQFSLLFEKRMSPNNFVDQQDFHEGPLEESEHIRLSLVELMSESAAAVEPIDREAASRICKTVAKHVFNDPFPDILSASCKLVQTLARLSPAAVNEFASVLLLQLAGKDVKHCLFRHRRSKIRSEAVETSSAIVLCCFQASEKRDDSSSLSSSIQEALESILLPGWEELLKTDASASVRIAVLNAVGITAKKFIWSHSPSTEQIFESMKQSSFVESHVLSLFVLGVSDGNTQVQESAIQQMMNTVNINCSSHPFPWDLIAGHYQALAELISASCLLPHSTCKEKVRSLEALQVCLSFVIATVDNYDSTSGESPLTRLQMQSIVECLRKSIVSEEKDVLQAALKASTILGGSTLSVLVLDMMTDSNSSEENIELSKDALAMISTPREAASTMLLLSRMVQGLICNNDAAAILSILDPTLIISTPNWLYSSSSSMTTITTLLSHPFVTDNVAENPSLAWSLLDALSEVVKCCTHHLNSGEEVHEGSWTLKEESVLDILTSIVHLLGCPAAFGLSDVATEVLQEFSSCFKCDYEPYHTQQTLIDVYFCKLVPKIIAAAESTFPWKESHAAFLAMTALLRHVTGSTVSNNFELVAPFFIHHISSSEIAQDEEVEEYSLRITLMSLLHSILSDETFHCQNTTKIAPTQIILSLVLPSLVWRPGGLASALRKLSVATIYSMLYHIEKVDEASSVMHSDTLNQLIPSLHSCLEDTESVTRELACLCLSLMLEQTSSDPEIFQDERVIHTLLSKLDDSHNPTRLAACRALKCYVSLQQPSEKVVSSLIVHLDDDERQVKEQVHEVLESALNQQLRLINGERDQARDHGVKVLASARQALINALQTQRDGSYCSSLLGLILDVK